MIEQITVTNESEHMMLFLERFICFAALIQAFCIDQSSARLQGISGGGFRLHAATVGVYISWI